MAQLNALLKIRADVDGEGRIAGLSRALGGLNSAAATASKGLRGMASSMGGLSGMLSSLVPFGVGAGLTTIAKGSIDAADNMNDLAQKTGVSVEQLSRFEQAARAGGTSIESVGGAMLQLNKRLESGKAQGALKGLGISATDASGRLKSTDQIMLEVADKFRTMPDGANKSAIAMQLFGRSGAELIPVLNGGGDAIRKLSATMSTDFAKSADNLNDKLAEITTKFTAIGVKLGEAFLPLMVRAADAVVSLVSAFEKLPGPAQAAVVAIGGLALVLPVVVQLIANLIVIGKALAALKIGATIAGWLGAVGPAIVAIKAALAGVLAWLSGTLLPGLLAFFSGPVGWTVLAVAAVVAMALLFREPIMKFFGWLGDSFRRAFDQLGPILSNAVQGLRKFIDPIGKFFSDAFGKLGQIARQAMEFVGGVIRWGMQAAYAILWQIFVQPYINLWNVLLKQPVTMFWEWAKGVVTGASTAISQAFQTYIAQPFANLWNNTLRGPVSGMMQWLRNTWTGFVNFFQTNIIAPITGAWKAMTDFLPNAMRKVQEFVTNIWNGIINTIRSAVRVVLQGIVNSINAVTSAINLLIRGFNRLPGPDIPLIPQVQIPAFAEGGIVRRPTLAMVGEGGEPEYIIPASKMAGASSRFLAGQRGDAVLSGGGTGGGAPQINITTGPVLQQDGQRYVSVEDLERAMRITAESVMGRLRTPSARIALGLR